MAGRLAQKQEPDHKRELQAALRSDLSSFVQKTFSALEPGTLYEHNWHIDHLCWQLARVEAGEIRRLIINVPPRSMKSITASVAFPAWVLGRNSTRRIICVSYVEELARKLSLDTKRVMGEPWYRELFPSCKLTTQRPRDVELKTTEQGYRYAAGVGGAVLGRGADLIILDDPIKSTDALSAAERQRVADFYDSTLYTRLNDKRSGAIVIIMQRLHEHDLVGHVLERDEWEVVSIPAIEPDAKTYRLDANGRVYQRQKGEALHAREPLDVLERVRRSQGSLTFNAQYQQAPAPADGNVVRREWLQTYENAPRRFDLKIASWDTASTISESADYSVGTVWGAVGADFYLLDVVRDRLVAPDLRHAILRLARWWEVDQLLIEHSHTGLAMAQDIRRTTNWRPVLVRPRGDKKTRFEAQSCRFEAGQVLVPDEAAWLGDWVGEILAFPRGRHDDQVDSTSQALYWLSRRYGRLLRPGDVDRPTPRRPARFERPPSSPGLREYLERQRRTW